MTAARALLAEIGAAERGEAPQPAAVGNAYSVAISPDGVTIRNAVIEDSRPEQYGFDELRQALGDLDRRDRARPPQPSLTAIAGAPGATARIVKR